MTTRPLVLVLALAVMGVAFLVYAGSLDNEFVWDDPIVFDRQLPFFDDLGDVFFPAPNIPQFGEHYYRPVGVISYLVDEWVAKTFWPEAKREEARRVVYHTSPVVYHAIATGLVFALGLALLRLRPDAGSRASTAPLIAAAGALLFAVHPIHVESVAWMAGRSDVLCGVFFLLALLLFLRYRTRGGPAFFAASVVAGLLAALTKETGLGVFGMMLLVAWLVPAGSAVPAVERPESRAERRRRERERPAAATRAAVASRLHVAIELGIAAAALLAYFLLRRAGIQRMGSPALDEVPNVGRLFGSLGWYVKKTIWPPPQSAFVAEVPGGLVPLLGVAALAGFAAVLVLALRRRRAVPEVLAGALFFAGLALSLAIALFPISETPLAERYLYIPSAGVCLLLAFLLARGTEGRPYVLALVPLVAVPLSVATVARAEVWSNNLAFWSDAVAKAPGEGLPHLHLGITYAERNELEKAAQEYQAALKGYRDAEGLSKAHNNYGSLLLRMQRFDDAIEQFKLALVQDPNYETPHYNWALTILNQAQPLRDPAAREAAVRDAIGHFEIALKINPRYVKAHYQYGALLHRLGQTDRAAPHLRRVLELAPASAEAREARTLLSRP